MCWYFPASLAAELGLIAGFGPQRMEGTLTTPRLILNIILYDHWKGRTPCAPDGTATGKEPQSHGQGASVPQAMLKGMQQRELCVQH